MNGREGASNTHTHIGLQIRNRDLPQWRVPIRNLQEQISLNP